MRFNVGGRPVTVKRKAGTIYFSVKAAAGTPVSVAPLGARDRFENGNGAAFSSR